MKNKRLIGITEFIFDILYLCIGGILGAYMLITATDLQQKLYGIMALLLVFGDSFHLVPRIKVILKQDESKFIKQLGFGKMITSITMTVFYLILWHIGVIHFPEADFVGQTKWIYMLATIRIILCLCPQNRWTQKDAPYKWNIYRNIPFLMLGGMVMLLFFLNANPLNLCLQYMWIAIALSYIFYIPVVLWAHKYPMLGMLMLPKSCIYIWIICMGLNL